MIGDRELGEFREGYYRLFATLFAREPTPEFLGSLGEGLAGRAQAAERLHPSMGEGWREIEACLGPPEAAQQIADEFTVLFVGPQPALHPYESYYLTGKFYTEPLAAVRSLLKRAGLAKAPEVFDPEDALAFGCEAMARLIARQLAAGNPDDEAKWAHLQGEFLKHHLLVWVPRFAADLSREPRARLYRGVAKLLQGFLELEREVIVPWGPEGFRSYEEARAAMARRGQWRGPLFEPPGSPEQAAGSGTDAQSP